MHEANSEATLKRRLVQTLGEDFEIIPDVEGYHLIEKSKVIVDYMAFPKQHLILNGFSENWFGIEVKYIKDFGRADLGKKTRLIWQAITYSQSAFYIEGTEIRPAYILVYVGENQFDESMTRIRGMTDGEWAFVTWRALINLGQYSNVGQLLIAAKHGWEIHFSGGKYYSKYRGKGKANVGVNRYVGSI